MKWIKANERLPEKEDFYYIKEENGGMAVRILSNNSKRLNDICWLDESTDELQSERDKVKKLREELESLSEVLNLSGFPTVKKAIEQTLKETE